MMRRSRLRSTSRAVLGAAAIAIGAARLDAQGTLSGQGFGYVPGQLSTRSLALGGAFAELDPRTPRNPASIAGWGPAGLHMQYDPEFRRLATATGEDRTVVARFPLMAIATNIGQRLTASAGISTLLDRTYTTSLASEQPVEGAPLATTTFYESTGGINDVRLALGWSFRPNLRAGIAGHVVAGENRVRLTTTFDRVGFAPVTETSEVSYSGATVSAGATWRPISPLSLGASGRLEGSLRANRNDSTLASARLPSRYGVSAAYTGIAGAMIVAGANWEQWSSVDPLGSVDVVARDTREIGVGAEVDGPRVRGNVMLLRGGARWRDLPFEAAGSAVRERTVGGGFGIPLATIGGVPRALLDFGAQRAARTGPTGFRESSWTLSFGLTVRP